MRSRDPAKEAAIRRQALKLLFEQGFDGFSMQKLARAARVSPATLYIYFEDRDDLILQLYSEEMQKMTDAALRGFDPQMPFREGLRVQWINRAEYYLAYPVESHFLEQVRFSPFHDAAMKRMDPRFHDAMRGFVHGAIERGELVSIPVEVYWSVAYAPLYQLLKFHLQRRSFPGSSRFVCDSAALEQTLELVVRALTPVPGPRVRTNRRGKNK